MVNKYDFRPFLAFFFLGLGWPSVAKFVGFTQYLYLKCFPTQQNWANRKPTAIYRPIIWPIAVPRSTNLVLIDCGDFGWVRFLIVSFLHKTNPNPRKTICCEGKSGPILPLLTYFFLGWVGLGLGSWTVSL